MYKYNHKTQKLNYTKLSNTYANELLHPYMSWLDYKRIHHIVRYYPTFNMYMKYRYYCRANNLTPYGEEINEYIAYEALLNELAKRVT